jgi:hypothetical protein
VFVVEVRTVLISDQVGLEVSNAANVAEPPEPKSAVVQGEQPPFDQKLLFRLLAISWTSLSPVCSAS